MVMTLKSSIDKRLPGYQKDESYIIAAVLDPRFKMRWCPDDIQEHVESVIQKCASNLSNNDSSNGEEPTGQPPPKKLKGDIFSFMKSKSERKRHKSSTNNEIASYLSVPCEDMDYDPLVFWNTNGTQYPTLSKMARKYLAVPASSAPVERLFSIAGKVFRPDRCSLKDDTFEKLMIVKCNSKC